VAACGDVPKGAAGPAGKLAVTPGVSGTPAPAQGADGDGLGKLNARRSGRARRSECPPTVHDGTPRGARARAAGTGRRPAPRSSAATPGYYVKVTVGFYYQGQCTTPTRVHASKGLRFYTIRQLRETPPTRAEHQATKRNTHVPWCGWWSCVFV